MKKLCRNLTAVTAVAGAALLFAGCEDPGAAGRAEAQAELTAAANDFQNVVLSQAGAVDEAGRTELRSILNRLTSATSNADAGAGQKSAAQLLAADIHRLLADSQLNAIDELRGQQRAQRLALYSMISSAERLESIATAIEAGTVEEQVAMLTEERSRQEEALRQEQAAIAQVETPISELETKIGSARAEVTDLRTQENQLRRQAAELGYFQGFETYEQAISVRQQADQIETNTSYDELSREYEYVPQREMHEQRIEQIEGAIVSIDLAVEELRANEASAGALATKTRQALETQIDQINTEVEALTARLDNELKPAIDLAVQDLSAAASKAQQAANATPAGGTSARLTSASANSSLGQLQAAWAFEQEQHAALLNRLASSNLPGTSGKYTSQIGAAEQARAAAVEAAVAALTEAASTYQRISGANANSATALKHDVEVTIAALTGQAAPEAPVMEAPQSAPDASATSAPATAGSVQNGADSPEALAQALQGMNTPRGLFELARYQLPAQHAQYPSGALGQFLRAVSDSMNASAELMQALDEEFGRAAADQILAPMMAGMQAGMGNATVSSASVSSSTDNAAQISISMSNGQSSTIQAKQIGGRWYMDFFGTMMQAGGNQQGMDQMVQMMLPMMEASTRATRSITQRVRAGEFATPAEVTAAIQKAEQDAMGSAMPQGFPGAGRR